ncbi:MAG: STAS domain-containing protein [Nitrospirota bacterium]
MSGETISVVERDDKGSGSKIFTVRGIMDAVTSKQMDDHVLPVMEGGESDIILDLTDLEYVSSAGMMSLIRYHVLMMKKQKNLKIVKPPNPVYHTLQITGIAKHLDIYDNVQAALGA